MSYTYTALVSYFDSSDRLVNLTGAATVTAYNALTGATITGATITNIRVGVYRVEVTSATLTDVLFSVVPDQADQADHPDVAVMQEKVYHVADDILTDTGTTLPASIAAVDTDVWTYSSRTLTQSATSISSAVSGSTITDIRGNDWSIDIADVTLDTNKQQFAIKYTNLDTDAESILLVDTATGLLYVNGAAASDATKASLSYAGTTLTVTVDASITAQLPTGSYRYGIQSVTAAGVVAENYGGTFTITADTVWATE